MHPVLARAGPALSRALTTTESGNCKPDLPLPRPDLFRDDRLQAWLANVVAFDPDHQLYHNDTTDYFVHAHMAYDENIQAKRTIEMAVVGNDKPELLDVLELFDRKEAYVVNIRAKTCQKFDIKYPFVPVSPPQFANFTGMTTIGVAGLDGIDLKQYEARDEKAGVALYQTYTARDCIPVRHDFISDDTGFHYAQLSDVLVGIPDRTVFDIPEVCRK